MNIKKHKDDNHKAIEDSLTDVNKQMQKQIEVLQFKYKKYEEFVNSINKQKEKISKSGIEVKTQTKEKLTEFRNLLDAKIIEVDKQIDNAINNKEKHVDKETLKAKQKMETIQNSINDVNKMMKEKKTPIEYLSLVEDCEEDIRHVTSSAEPKAEIQWFQLPPFYGGPQNFQYIEEIIKKMKYSEKAVFDPITQTFIVDNYDYDNGDSDYSE